MLYAGGVCLSLNSSWVGASCPVASLLWRLQALSGTLGAGCSANIQRMAVRRAGPICNTFLFDGSSVMKLVRRGVMSVESIT